MELIDRALDIVWSCWKDGGWLMLALVGLAMTIGVLAIRTLLEVRLYQFHVTDSDLENYLNQPSHAPKHLHGLFSYAGDGNPAPAELTSRIEEIRQATLSKLKQNTTVLSILVSAAPLLGLLGTVMGMLTTFTALSSGNDEAIAVIASGISAALITTETGLIISIPGYFLLHLAKRQIGSLEHFFSRIQRAGMRRHRNRQSRPEDSLTMGVLPEHQTLPATTEPEPVFIDEPAPFPAS